MRFPALAVTDRVAETVFTIESIRRSIGKCAVSVVDHAPALGRAGIGATDSKRISVGITVVGQNIPRSNRASGFSDRCIIPGDRWCVFLDSGLLGIGVVTVIGIGLIGADCRRIGYLARAIGPRRNCDAPGTSIFGNGSEITIDSLTGYGASTIIRYIAKSGRQCVGHGHAGCIPATVVGYQQAVGDLLANQHRIGSILFYQSQVDRLFQLEQIGSTGVFLRAILSRIC